jgi:hypothetical protein
MDVLSEDQHKQLKETIGKHLREINNPLLKKFLIDYSVMSVREWGIEEDEVANEIEVHIDLLLPHVVHFPRAGSKNVENNVEVFENEIDPSMKQKYSDELRAIVTDHAENKNCLVELFDTRTVLSKCGRNFLHKTKPFTENQLDSITISSPYHPSIVITNEYLRKMKEEKTKEIDPSMFFTSKIPTYSYVGVFKENPMCLPPIFCWDDYHPTWNQTWCR